MKTLKILPLGMLLFSVPLLFVVGQEAGSEKDPVDNVKNDWTQLFNGKDLTGWSQKNGSAAYEVVDGTIMGTTADGSPNSFLCTNEEFADFELEFEVRLLDPRLNSGVQIRSRSRNDERVFGPQVEIEASGNSGAEAGYVYGEATGRGWLTPQEQLKPTRIFKDDQWNSYRILAKGPRIQTWVNGISVEDLTDEPIHKSHPSGFIGLQVHSIPKGSGPYQVQWRNIKLRKID